MYALVHKDSSTEPTNKFPAEVGFGKKSIVEFALPLPLGAVLSVVALRLLHREDARRQFRERLDMAG